MSRSGPPGPRPTTTTRGRSATVDLLASAVVGGGAGARPVGACVGGGRRPAGGTIWPVLGVQLPYAAVDGDVGLGHQPGQLGVDQGRPRSAARPAAIWSLTSSKAEGVAAGDQDELVAVDASSPARRPRRRAGSPTRLGELGTWSAAGDVAARDRRRRRCWSRRTRRSPRSAKSLVPSSCASMPVDPVEGRGVVGVARRRLSVGLAGEHEDVADAAPRRTVDGSVVVELAQAVVAGGLLVERRPAATLFAAASAVDDEVRQFAATCSRGSSHRLRAARPAQVGLRRRRGRRR